MEAKVDRFSFVYYFTMESLKLQRSDTRKGTLKALARYPTHHPCTVIWAIGALFPVSKPPT